LKLEFSWLFLELRGLKSVKHRNGIEMVKMSISNEKWKAGRTSVTIE